MVSKGKGLDLGAEPPRTYKTFLSNPVVYRLVTSIETRKEGCPQNVKLIFQQGKIKILSLNVNEYMLRM